MIPSLFILVPFVCVLFLNMPFKALMNRLVSWVGIAVCLLQIIFILFIEPSLLHTRFFSGLAFFKFDLLLDNLGNFMLLSIGIVMLIAFLMAKALESDLEYRFSFMNIMLIMLIGLNGIVLVKGIFSLYVFLEITAATSFILISFFRKRDALEGAFKYFMLSTTATIFLLISISLVFLAVGDVSFVAIQNALRSSSDNKILVLGLCFFLAGLFIKAGAVPFHGWLADAHSAAPSIVSVILSGIVVETMGVYPLIRVLMSLNLQGLSISISIRSIFMLVGTISIIVGALAAIGQSDFKRMLAYSTTSQVGYMLLGLGCGTSLGIAACAFHLFNHAIFKSLLFLNAGCVEHQVGTRDINKMGGLSKKMPITGIASLLSCLSIVGIPPLSGFWSKLLIIIALWVSGNYYFAYIAILASLLTLGYCLVLQRKAFFGQVASGLENVKEVGFGLALPAIILTVILVVVGIIAPFILNSYVLPVGNILK